MTRDITLDTQVRRKNMSRRNINTEELMKIIKIRSSIEIKNMEKHKQDKKATTDYEISLQKAKIVKKRM